MELVSICGDNCSCCPRYTATQTGSPGELEKVKTLWVKLGLRDKNFPARQMACQGCRPENSCAYEALRECVIQREIPNCGSCPEYPCRMTAHVFDASERLRLHAERICTREEMRTLTKAFFSKKQIFIQMKRKQ